MSCEALFYRIGKFVFIHVDHVATISMIQACSGCTPAERSKRRSLTEIIKEAC